MIACEATSFWFGPLSQKLVCGREPGHTGCHVAFFPKVSVGFTDDREFGTVILRKETASSSLPPITPRP